MISALRKKLASKRGFTLTELLITTAIMLLVAMAVSVGISTSAKAYREVTASSEASALCGSIAVELTAELRFARNISVAGSTPVFDSERFGTGVSVRSDGAGHITIGTATQTPTETSLVLPEKAYTNKLRAAADASYTAATGFTLTIAVQNATGEDLETATVNIMPLSV